MSKIPTMCPRYFYLLFLTLSSILLLLVLWLISAFVTPSTSSFVMLISVSCQGWISHTTTIVLDQVCVLVSTMPCTQAIHEFNSWASLFFSPIKFASYHLVPKLVLLKTCPPNGEFPRPNSLIDLDCLLCL